MTISFRAQTALLAAGMGLSTILLTGTSLAKTTWLEVYVQANSGNAVTAFDALDATHAWGAGLVSSGGNPQQFGILTQDGATWLPMMLPGGQFTIYTQIKFADAQNGWMGAFRAVGPALWRTRNGGMMWEEAFLPSTDLEDMQTVGGGLFAVGGSVLVAAPDGEQYAEIPVAAPAGLTLQGLFMLTPSCGYVVAASDPESGSYASAVLWTGDGGQTWETRTEALDFRMKRVWFVTSDVGWGAGKAADSGVIASTTDGGRTWTRQAVPAHPPLLGGEPAPSTDCTHVRFFDDARGVALCLACTGNCDVEGENPSFVTIFVRTENGGQSWEMDAHYEDQMLAPPFPPIMGKGTGMLNMSFPDPNVGYLAGQNNMILRYVADVPEAPAWPPPDCSPGGGTAGAGAGGGAGAPAGSGADFGSPDSGCGCRVEPSRRGSLAWLAGLGWLALSVRRRRH